MGKLGVAIRQRRKDLKIKVYELARDAGVHPTYITYIEKHDRMPSLEIIDKLEKQLKIPLKAAYLAEKHPTLRPSDRADIVITLNNGNSIAVNCKSPRRAFEFELTKFLSTPMSQQDAQVSAISCLSIIDPGLKNDTELVKIFARKIAALKQANDQFKKRQNMTIKGLITALPVLKATRPHLK